MTEKEIKDAIEDIDDEVLLTIIDCCKELFCNGIQMCFWDRDSVIDVLHDVYRGNNNER
jgi:hypothetical protein